MQEMTMVERVARAIAQAETGSAENWKSFKCTARVAIEAMRDPSEKLMEKADLDNDKSPAPYCTDWSYFRMQINAMIDAALSE